MNKYYLFPVLLSIISLLSACASMEAVQTYAAFSQATVNEVRPVARDFYQSCMRANSNKPLKFHSKCTTEKNASMAILQVAEVLNDYAAALGALASDELVAYDQDIGMLTDELNGLQQLNKQQVESLGGLAQLIARTSTSLYQQKQVGKFIIESNESVRSVATTLADIIEKNYSHALAIEITAWEDGYKKAEKVIKGSKPMQWELYAQQKMIIRAQLQEKMTAVKDLADNIRNIATTHEKLKDDAENLSSREVAAIVRNFVNDTKPVIKEVQASF